MLIDLHSHLIPGVDDGAQTIEESLALARQAVSEGIEHSVLTPHHSNGQYNNYGQDVIRRVKELQEIYNQEGIPLTIYPGQEIRLTEQFMDDLYNNQLLSLDGGGRYYLCEFPTKTIPTFAKSVFEELIRQGMTPVIAHPERNHAIMQDYSILQEFIEMGCVGQLTAVSYSGQIGERFLKVARDFIGMGLVQIMSSDAHSVEWRPLNMKVSYDRMLEEFGTERVQLFQANARAIINGDDIQKLYPMDNQIVRKRRVREKKRFFGLF